MVEDSLLSKDGLDFEEYAITPDPDQLVPESIEKERRRVQFARKLEDDPPVVILTHFDADGLTSAALMSYRHQNENVAVEQLEHHGSFGFSDAFDVLDEHHYPSVLYILDFNFESQPGAYESLFECPDSTRIEVYDHHQWDDRETFEQLVDDFVIDTDECTASLIAESIGLDFPDRLLELAEVTKDHDLWIKEDPRSGSLQTFAVMSEPEEYIPTVLDHGINLPESVQQKIESKEEDTSRANEIAVEDADWVTVGDYEVALTYTGKGRSSRIGNLLCEERSADLAVVQSTSGGGSIYSHSNREVFARCHEVASELGGGGHPTASGYGHDFSSFRDLVQYWNSCGRTHRNQVFDAIEEVVDDENANSG